MFHRQNLVVVMANVTTLGVLDNYFNTLKVNCGTADLSELHRMTLIPLIQDILDGKLTQYVTMCDKRFWLKWLNKCFPGLSFGKGSHIRGDIHVGTSSEFPTEEIILNMEDTEHVYHLDADLTNGKFKSPETVYNFFWIALPNNTSLKSVSNDTFGGDFIPLESFHRIQVTLNKEDYTLYYIEGVIPFNNVYTVEYV